MFVKNRTAYGYVYDLDQSLGLDMYLSLYELELDASEDHVVIRTAGDVKGAKPLLPTWEPKAKLESNSLSSLALAGWPRQLSLIVNLGSIKVKLVAETESGGARDSAMLNKARYVRDYTDI